MITRKHCQRRAAGLYKHTLGKTQYPQRACCSLDPPKRHNEARLSHSMYRGQHRAGRSQSFNRGAFRWSSFCKPSSCVSQPRAA